MADYLNRSLVLKHLLGNLVVGVGRSNGNDYENVAHISNPEHSSLEKSLKNTMTCSQIFLK